MLLILLGLLLSGCGKKDDNSSTEASTEEGSQTETVSEEDEEDDDKNDDGSGKKSRKKDPSDEKASDSALPEYFISKHGDYDYSEHAMVRSYRYSFLHLSDDFGDSHSGLRKSINSLNKDIESAREDRFSDEAEILSDWYASGNEYAPSAFNDEWNVYVTRSDEKYFSAVEEQRQDSMVGDFVDIHYTGYNWDTESGKEITLSDILKDEDGFYDELTESISGWIKNTTEDDSWDYDALNDKIRDLMNTGEMTWAFFPQGVQVWIDSYIFSPESAGIFFFFDDTDGDAKYFKKEYVNSVPDEWIVMPIKGSTQFYDLEDDGDHDSIIISDRGDLVEVEGGEIFTYEGIYIGVDDDWKEVETKVSGGSDPTDVYLVHQDKKTVLLTSHNEFTCPYLNTWLLSGKKIEEADELTAHFAYVPESEREGDETYEPYYVPDDPASFDVVLVSKDDPDDETKAQITLNPDGTFTQNGSGVGGAKKNKNKTLSKSKKKNEGGLSKEDAAEIADNLGGMVCALERHDYDGDGADEAFVVTGEKDEYDGYLPDAVWFIASDGSTKKLRTDFKDLSMYQPENGHYMEYKDENKAFFYGDCGAYGSGWTTFIFGVKDGEPYEMDISMDTEGFYQDEPGVFYTLTDDFTDGHAYLKTELEYNKKTGQFKKGKITDENWAE